MHGVLGYAGFMDAWTYSGVNEVTLMPAVEIPLLVLIAPFGLALMTALFLVAGLLTPSSVERKGTGRFARDRLLRLGIPFVLYVGVLQPTLVYALEHPLGRATGSYWQEYLGSERQLDTGPLWFVGVLLIFSVGYAAWVRWRPTGRRRDVPAVGPRHLVLIAFLVAPLSFAVRLIYPYGGEAGFTDLNFWQWPACAAAFGVGIVSARHGWLDGVPDRVTRLCRRVALASAVVMAGFLTVAGFLDLLEDAMGGWSWASAGFTVIETALSVFGAVWLLAAAQHWLERPLPWGNALGRSAYAAFIVQAPVLIGLAVALRPLPWAAEPKAAVVAIVGMIVSFALARLLTRIPGVSRVL
jgi:hypothetical protein